MATCTELVGICVQFYAVRIVAIHTLNSLMKHLALNVRSINVDFVVNLSVDMIGGHAHIGRPRLGDFREKVVKKLAPAMVTRVYKATTGVTFGTRFNLSNIGAIDVSKSKIVQSVPALSCTGKFNMGLSRTVAGFTGNIHLGISGGKSL